MDSKQQLIQNLKRFQEEYNIYPQLAAAAAKLQQRLEKTKPYPPELEQFMRRIRKEFQAASIMSDLTEAIMPEYFGPHYVFGISSKIHFRVPIQHDFKSISEAINRAAPEGTDKSARITFRPSHQSAHQICAYTVKGDIENLASLAEAMDLKIVPITSTDDGQIEAQLVDSQPFSCIGTFIIMLQKLTYLAQEHKCTINEGKHLSLNNSHEVIGLNKIERAPFCLASLPNISVDPLIYNFVGVQAKFSDFKGDILICTHQNHVDIKENGWYQLGYFLSEAKQSAKKAVQSIIKSNVQANGFNLTTDFVFIDASLFLKIMKAAADLIDSDFTTSPDLARLLPEQEQLQQELD